MTTPFFQKFFCRIFWLQWRHHLAATPICFLHISFFLLYYMWMLPILISEFLRNQIVSAFFCLSVVVRGGSGKEKRTENLLSNYGSVKLMIYFIIRYSKFLKTCLCRVSAHLIRILDGSLGLSTMNILIHLEFLLK